MLLLMMIACLSEISIYDITYCHQVGDYEVCSLRVTYDEAVDQCDGYLVEINDKIEQDIVTGIGDFEFGEPWWGGHEDGTFSCPAMSMGASYPFDCFSELPFICETE